MSNLDRVWNIALLVAGLVLISVSPTAAQSPLDACQDQLRGVRVYADRLGKSRQADDLDAAQVIANLIKQVEALRGEVDQAKQQLQERAKATEKPKE